MQLTEQYHSYAKFLQTHTFSSLTLMVTSSLISWSVKCFLLAAVDILACASMHLLAVTATTQLPAFPQVPRNAALSSSCSRLACPLKSSRLLLSCRFVLHQLHSPGDCWHHVVDCSFSCRCKHDLCCCDTSWGELSFQLLLQKCQEHDKWGPTYWFWPALPKANRSLESGHR